MPDPLNPKVIEARRLRGLGWSLGKIAKEFGLSKAWAAKVCKVVPSSKSKRTETEDATEIEVFTDKPVKSLEDAVAAASVDLKVWYVEKWECSQWTVGMNVKQGIGLSRPVQTQQYRVKVVLRRIMRRTVQEAVSAVFDEMKKYSPKYKKVRLPQSGTPTLAVVGLFDAHFGKLAWKPETGTDYDLKIAQNVFRNAVVDLIARCQNHRKIEKFCLPVGNDFFHIDNKQNTTLRGTPQDTDGRYIKIFQAGKLAVIWAIEQMMQYADVDVVWVPGNHDPTMSYHLAETIDSWFHKSKQVKVDITPPTRKYYRWNDTLIGLTHGDAVKPENLPNLMAVERPEDWAATTCREWLIGHRHRSIKWITKSTDTFEGTIVRTLQSLSGTDAWHYENGYVNTRRAAEVLFYEKDFGYAGDSIAQARFDD